MSKGGYDLPLRNGNLDTRPMVIEEWLDSLPYVDFKRTARLIEAATRASNEQPVKAATRMELVQLYNRPYQYYIESQVRTGAHHTLQSMETMQDQIASLKQIAVNLGLACKLAAEEAAKQKTVFKASRPPLAENLGTLHYLSHALIFSFLEYAPTPRGVWSELHRIYRSAESLQKEYEILLPPGGNAKSGGTSISSSYLRIVMAALADPNHLPFGAIWEIYEQLRTWTEFVHLRQPDDTQAGGGRFVIDLDGDNRPVPLSKFREKLSPARHRVVDAAALGGVIEDLIERLESSQTMDADIRMSPYFARTVMHHMLRTWGLPPERTHPREPRGGAISMVRGIGGVYFHLNGEREMEPNVDPDAEEDELETVSADSVARTVTYNVETWNLVDQAPGGIAVISSDRPNQSVRVGELIAFSEENGGSWSVGVIRWLMIKQGRQFRLGVQVFPGKATAVDVRATTGSKQDRGFRRALLFPPATGIKAQTIVTERGLFSDRRPLEVRTARGTVPVLADALIEGSVAFEQIAIMPASKK